MINTKLFSKLLHLSVNHSLGYLKNEIVKYHPKKSPEKSSKDWYELNRKMMYNGSLPKCAQVQKDKMWSIPKEQVVVRSKSRIQTVNSEKNKTRNFNSKKKLKNFA